MPSARIELRLTQVPGPDVPSSFNMCFYDMVKFECGDWKWLNFRQHCQQEYRTGETCGRKFVMNTYEKHECCSLCEKLKTKYRRRQQEVDRITRWTPQQHKYRCSIEKAMGTIAELDDSIRKLLDERSRRLYSLGNLSSGGHASAYGYN